LKIEIPANRQAQWSCRTFPSLTECAVFRYDLLCIEGIARALRTFLQISDAPTYKLVFPPGGEKDLLTVTIDPEVISYLLFIKMMNFSISIFYFARRQKSDPFLPAPSFATSSSHPAPMHRSSICKISSIKIFVDEDSLLQLARTI
jgi:hypothetical protein